jgi:hypothetical protein
LFGVKREKLAKNGGTVKRTTIFLTEEQVKKLAKTAARKGINAAQLIRIYINAGLEKDS